MESMGTLLVIGGLCAVWTVLSSCFGDDRHKEHPSTQGPQKPRTLYSYSAQTKKAPITDRRHLGKAYERVSSLKPAFEDRFLTTDRQWSPPLQQNRYQDQHQANKHNEYYLALRTRAHEEGDLMAQCFQQSQEAYERRDHALAKVLSEEGKQHKQKKESLNTEASTWIYRRNNLDRELDEVDLHGLHVAEAISFADRAIQEARERGDSEIRLIVGKGLHCDDQGPKIKPALVDHMRKRNLLAEVDSLNAGVLVVRLRRATGISL